VLRLLAEPRSGAELFALVVGGRDVDPIAWEAALDQVLEDLRVEWARSLSRMAWRQTTPAGRSRARSY
jgi:hypothetical protein